jgi:microcystin-dependent protein
MVLLKKLHSSSVTLPRITFQFLSFKNFIIYKMSKYPSIEDYDFQDKIGNIYDKFKLDKKQKSFKSICFPDKFTAGGKSVNIGENLKVIGTAGISSIRIGIASASTIDTSAQNLYLNSAGGNVIVNDNLHVSDNIRVAGLSTFVSNVSAGASITSVGDIVAGSSAQFKGYGTIPISGIIMWSGSVATIPSGWALCDGTSGTPDLRERFIVGAGGDNPAVAGTTGYTPGTQGGLNSVTLDSTQIPAHTHLATSTTTTTISPANVLTDVTTTTAARGTQGSTAIISITETLSATSGISTTNTIIQPNTGGGGSHENRPPYYALAFIMRTL